MTTEETTNETTKELRWGYKYGPFSTSDYGADTCVFGDGWVVRSVHSTGRPNLICFDTQATLKTGLDLITADTLTRTDDYGVHNPGSCTKLISDAQIRRAGAIVNACPVDKLVYPYGRKGSQTLVFFEA
jgi:hypothetical protein